MKRKVGTIRDLCFDGKSFFVIVIGFNPYQSDGEKEFHAETMAFNVKLIKSLSVKATLFKLDTVENFRFIFYFFFWKKGHNF